MRHPSLMRDYGFDAADIAYATGQSVRSIGQYLRANGAADGFAGWTDAGGYNNPGTPRNLAEPTSGVSAYIAAQSILNEPPRARPAQQWADIKAVWLDRRDEPYRLMQTMVEFGFDARDISYAAGVSMRELGLYFSRAGAPVGFAGAEIIDRDAVDSAYLQALNAASYAQAQPQPGTPVMFDINAFTAAYAARDTQAARDFALLNGANFSLSSVYVSPGSWQGNGDMAQWTWQAPAIHRLGDTATSSQKIRAYLGFVQADPLELDGIDLILADPLSREVMQHFGSAVELPSSEYVERMRARYGSQRATDMYRLTLANQAVRDAYAQALDAQQNNVPLAESIIAQGPGQVLDSQNTYYTSRTQPWWSVTQHTEYDNHHSTSVYLNLQVFTDWYAKQDTVASRLFAQQYGSQLTTAHQTDNLGEGDSQPWRQTYIGQGGSFEVVPGHFVATGDQGTVWVPASAGGFGLTMASVPLDGGSEVMALYDPNYIVFDPVMGFVTPLENIDNSNNTDWIAPVVVGILVGAGTAGAATAAGAGPIVAAGVSAGVGTLASSAVATGEIDWKAVIKSALIGMATAGFGQAIDPNGATGRLNTETTTTVTDPSGVVTTHTIVSVSTDWLARLPIIGAKAVFSGLLSEITGGRFEQGFTQALANQLASEVTFAINASIAADPDLSVAERAGYNLMGRGLASAIRVLATPGDPGQALAIDFLNQLGVTTAEPGGGSSTPGAVNQTVFDDEGYLMPGIVNTALPPEQQRQQVYDRLIQQGLNPQAAQNLTQYYFTHGNVAGWVGPGATGSGGGTPAPTTGVTNRVAFDDEGNLMPGIVNPSLPPLVQVVQLYNQLLQQGLSVQDAQDLTVNYFTTSTPRYNYNNGIPPGPNLRWTTEGWQPIEATGTGMQEGLVANAGTAPLPLTLDGLLAAGARLLTAGWEALNALGARALPWLSVLSLSGSTEQQTINLSSNQRLIVNGSGYAVLQELGSYGQWQTTARGLTLVELPSGQRVALTPEQIAALNQPLTKPNSPPPNTPLINVPLAPQDQPSPVIPGQSSDQNAQPTTTTTPAEPAVTWEDLIMDRSGQGRFRNGLIDQERAINPNFDPTGTFAHHVLPIKDFPQLQPLRDRFQAWGIDLNDLDNGILLGQAEHARTRSFEYRDAIQAAFRDVTTAAGARAVLSEIRNQLRNGTFIPPKP